jgi:hypothetical protein
MEEERLSRHVQFTLDGHTHTHTLSLSTKLYRVLFFFMESLSYKSQSQAFASVFYFFICNFQKDKLFLPRRSNVLEGLSEY